MNRPSNTTARESALSKKDLARYLFSLAEINSDPRFGNAALAAALRNLAQSLIVQNEAIDKGKPKIARRYHDLSPEEIRAMLSDELVNKAELVQLAGERFSIPHSQLGRMRRSEIILSILDALAHEESLEIISAEAQRAGRTN